jgi:hypothetical protein
MYRMQVSLGDQKFFIEEDDFLSLFETVSHFGEMNYRIREAKNVRWQVRRVRQGNKTRKFYDLVGYIKHDGENYRVEMTLRMYEEEGRPIPFFLRANDKWRWYDFESEINYEYHGAEEGFVEQEK